MVARLAPCHHLFLQFTNAFPAQPQGNRSKSLDIHPGLSDRCLPISLTLLGSYCEPPGCFNAPLRTELVSLGSASLRYRLLADTAADWIYAFPHSHNHQAQAYKTQKQIGEACNNSYNDDDTVVAAYLIPLQDANGAVGASTS